MGKLLYVNVIFKNKWAIVRPLHLNMKCLKSKRVRIDPTNFIRDGLILIAIQNA